MLTKRGRRGPYRNARKQPIHVRGHDAEVGLALRQVTTHRKHLSHTHTHTAMDGGTQPHVREAPHLQLPPLLQDGPEVEAIHKHLCALPVQQHLCHLQLTLVLPMDTQTHKKYKRTIGHTQSLTQAHTGGKEGDRTSTSYRTQNLP